MKDRRTCLLLKKSRNQEMVTIKYAEYFGFIKYSKTNHLHIITRKSIWLGLGTDGDNLLFEFFKNQFKYKQGVPKVNVTPKVNHKKIYLMQLKNYEH